MGAGYRGLICCIVLTLGFCQAMKIKTIAFDFENECFYPLVGYASTDEQDLSLSMTEYTNFFLEYGSSKGQPMDPNNPIIAVAFEKTADEYCNKLIQNCENDTIPINDELNDLSPSEKVYMFHVCEEIFLSLNSIFALDVPSSSPSFMPSTSDGAIIMSNINFLSYSSFELSEINQYFDNKASSWAQVSAEKVSTEDIFYQYRFIKSLLSITCKLL